MTRKDAGCNAAYRGRWNTPWSWAVGAAVVLAVCLVVRYVWGPNSAVAQAPPQGPRGPAAANRPPARSPAPASSSRQPAQPAAVTRPPAAAARPSAASPTYVGDGEQRKLQVMAVVNGQQITREHLANECLRRYGKEVLESIVNKHLILQQCQLRGITITNQDVENEIEHMAGKFGLSKDRWLAMLERERDIPAAQYRREIIWPTLALRHLASQQIEVSNEELQKAFESQYGPSVRVRIISVASREKAERLHAQAAAQPDRFDDLAKEHSEDTASAASRGLIPPIRKHVGHEDIERVAFALKEGEVSPVLHVANQYLILKCERHIPEVSVAGRNLQQIEAQLHDQIRDNKLHTAATDLFAGLQQQAKVVNVYNDPQLRQRMPGVAATVNDRQITLRQLAAECLLRHGKDVLQGEINRFVLQQELKRRGKTVNQREIDEEIARAADAYGYELPDGTPDVQAWLASVTEEDGVTVDLYVRDAVWPSVALKQLVGESVQVSEEDLQKGFQSNYGERVEVRAIVLASQRQANQVWKLARQQNSEEAFGELAHEHSIEPVSRANFGKVPPVRRFGGQPLIEEEAFKLRPGELSGIVAIGDKFVILRCQGRTKPVVQEFSAVRNELYKDIHEKKLRLAMAEEFDRLKEAAQIDDFLAGTSQAGQRQSAARAAPVAAPAAAPAAARGVNRASFQTPPVAPRTRR